MNDLDGPTSEMLARQTAAEEALITGDPAPRMAMWSRRNPVTLFSAGGQCRSGWDAIGAFFRWLANRFSNGSDFRFDVEAAEFSGDLGYTVGFERFNASVAGGPVQPIEIRVTHIYRRENGEWKIVHRHGDRATSEESLSKEIPPEEQLPVS